MIIILQSRLTISAQLDDTNGTKLHNFTQTMDFGQKWVNMDIRNVLIDDFLSSWKGSNYFQNSVISFRFGGMFVVLNNSTKK